MSTFNTTLEQLKANDALLAQLTASSAQARASNTQAYYRLLAEQRQRALTQAARDWADFEAECDALAESEWTEFKDAATADLDDLPF